MEAHQEAAQPVAPLREPPESGPYPMINLEFPGSNTA